MSRIPVTAEEKQLKNTPESEGKLWLKYVCLSLTLGVIIEVLAWVGNVYAFHPWWLAVLVILLLWGLVFGSIAMGTRRLEFLAQYIPGFLLLFAGEMMNTYYLGAWTYENGPLANIDPVLRSLVLSILAGFLIPIINAVMKKAHGMGDHYAAQTGGAGVHSSPGEGAASAGPG